MRRALGLVAVLLLAGCVAPQPFASPDTFRSPLTFTGGTRQYLPIMMGTSSKIGVGVGRATENCADIARLGVVWYYDWSPQPLDCPRAEAVPMLYAPGDGVLNPPILGTPCRLLIGNECDRPDQCATDPETFARWWHEIEQQYPQCQLIGPNTSRAGWEWLLAWRAAYIRLYGEPPRIYALGIHCYNPADWCEDWTIAHIALAETWTQSGTVWVTEWSTTGCYYSEPQPTNLDTALTDAARLQMWFDAQPGVARTAWFVAKQTAGACETALIGMDGELTEYGAWLQTTAQGNGVP